MIDVILMALPVVLLAIGGVFAAFKLIEKYLK